MRRWPEVAVGVAVVLYFLLAAAMFRNDFIWR